MAVLGGTDKGKSIMKPSEVRHTDYIRQNGDPVGEL